MEQESNSLSRVLNRYRANAFSQRDKGNRFETLIKGYFKTSPIYTDKLQEVWLWNEFPFRKDFGGNDTGIDIVARTNEGDYWAIQCKFYADEHRIEKADVDTFLSTSGRSFVGDDGRTVTFSNRFFVSTTNNWGTNAEEAIKNQHPPVNRISLSQLAEEPIDWEKLDASIYGKQARGQKKSPREHQLEAIKQAHAYYQTHDRGKLIMACGTGKTFTSLKLVENETQGNGLVLFLVPSIALLGQTLREWSYEAGCEIHAICVCSDAEVSRTKHKNEDEVDFSIEELALPATTDAEMLAKQIQVKRQLGKGITVVFSTYQSIDAVAKAQTELQRVDAARYTFDFIVCDEAHRTTGVKRKDEDASAFVKVHNDAFIRAKKRMYMTATPRLYKSEAKERAKDAEAYLWSMDDPVVYGDEFYKIGFGQAVDKDLLSDYKVLVLTVSEKQITPLLKSIQENADNPLEINADGVSKLVGCINALSKRMLIDNGMLKESDPGIMHRAVAFCQSIKISKATSALLNSQAESYYQTLSPEVRGQTAAVFAKHVDGGMSAPQREDKLSWLKAAPPSGNDCRILCNVKCLSEGVDVPTLDAVLFLSAKNSEIDVVQSVGRVMRRAEGKKYGYIIIPILVPPDVKPEDALNDNKRYQVVWTVLNALRAHDDRFEAEINKINLNRNRAKSVGRILVGGTPTGAGNPPDGEPDVPAGTVLEQETLQLYKELSGVIYAKMVQKVGNKHYWEQWAKNVGEIAQRIIARISEAVKSGAAKREFELFVNSLKKNLNPSVSANDAIEMLSQHIITQPVFDALFENYSFAKSNPVSVAMQKMLESLDKEYLAADLQSMEGFYKQVRMTVSGIDNAAGKQKIIVDLYDKFFKTALPKAVEKLGIVYTPVEVVDFILHSAADIFKKEFGQSISDEGVNILDPFTGTGTFISRLITTGLIRPQDLSRKYAKEIFANEIVLLAYYIAAINIENAFHDTHAESAQYRAFDGACLADTFQTSEADGNGEWYQEIFPQNSERMRREKATSFQLIVGNPPYFVGLKAATDNAQNQSYPRLEKRLEDTYVERASANNKNSLYDSYIKAFRWASDRLDPKGGIVAFITNAGWLESNSADGLRKCFEEEFSAIYVVNLRGNCRTSNEMRRKEGGNIFGIGSRTPIAITILVKKPNFQGKGTIYYKDIGDYLSREEKLNCLKQWGSISNPELGLETLAPDVHGDWLSQRNNVFQNFIPIHPEKKFDSRSQSFFTTYSLGVSTNRDIWVYNFSKDSLIDNMKATVDFYNKQVSAFKDARIENINLQAEDFISYDAKKISWSSSLVPQLERGNLACFEGEKIRIGSYRPFIKQQLYFGEKFIHRRGQFDDFFPTPQSENLVINFSSAKGASVLISDKIVDLHFIGDSQCFPLYWYEDKEDEGQRTLFDRADASYVRRNAVSDFILQRCREAYGPQTTREDIFYYVYGLLHSPAYREKFAYDLKISLPHIPLVESFWEYSKAGRALAQLHLNYERQVSPAGVRVEKAAENYRVDKLRFPKKGQKDTIIYNPHIKITHIPAEVYSYVVNGRSPVEWVMEFYQVRTDKDSGIVKDPNLWCKEHGEPKYILNLLLSVMTVSLKTQEIVKNLPDISAELG